MELGESLEDYLESILDIGEKIDHVRSVDVASYLGFSKPSVSTCGQTFGKRWISSFR